MGYKVFPRIQRPELFNDSTEDLGSRRGSTKKETKDVLEYFSPVKEGEESGWAYLNAQTGGKILGMSHFSTERTCDVCTSIRPKRAQRKKKKKERKKVKQMDGVV